MARLRNRIRKADYFSDGELLRWPRDKRTTYSGLYALAEDSGCLEDDCFTWKLLLWPSPLDADITVEKLEQWRDELIAAGKLIPYTSGGVRYLYLRSFHKHEHPRNPQENTLPLPPWVTGERHSTDGRKWVFTVHDDALPPLPDGSTSVEQASNESVTTSPALPCPALPGPALSLRALADASAPAGADDFAEWWQVYGKIGSKADAERLYRFWRTKGAEHGDLLTAAREYRAHCERTNCKMQHARTFLAKPPKGERARWYEWAEGEEHGSMDVADDDDLAAVLRAGAQTYGGNNGGRSSVCPADQPARPLGRREDDRLRVPAQCVVEGD